MITLVRPRQYGAGIMKYKVFANDQLICEIEDDQTLEIDLDSGTYVVFSKVLWFKSKEYKMNLENGDTLMIRTNKYIICLPVLPVLIYGLIVGLDLDSKTLVYSVLILVVLILINVPIVKRNYLKLSKL